MKVRDRKFFEKIICFDKILIRLARKTDNYIGPDSEFVNPAGCFKNQIPVIVGCISAPHQSQYIRATALQGNMKMFTHPIISRGKFQDLIGKEIRFYRTYPYPVVADYTQHPVQ